MRQRQQTRQDATYRSRKSVQTTGASSKYLRSLEKRGEIGTSKMDHILLSHLITAETLRADNFEAFFEARRHGLLDLIGKAMGKSPVAAAELSEPTGEPVEDEDDTGDDTETIEGNLVAA